MGVSPTDSWKRAAKTERDILATRASSSRVHGFPGCSWSASRAAASCGSATSRSQPAGAHPASFQARSAVDTIVVAIRLQITASPGRECASPGAPPTVQAHAMPSMRATIDGSCTAKSRTTSRAGSVSAAECAS